MQHWYAYTGKDLIAGQGRAIREVIGDVKMVERIVTTASTL